MAAITTMLIEAATHHQLTWGFMNANEVLHNIPDEAFIKAVSIIYDNDDEQSFFGICYNFSNYSDKSAKVKKDLHLKLFNYFTKAISDKKNGIILAIFHFYLCFYPKTKTCKEIIQILSEYSKIDKRIHDDMVAEFTSDFKHK